MAIEARLDLPHLQIQRAARLQRYKHVADDLEQEKQRASQLQ